MEHPVIYPENLVISQEHSL